MCRTTASAACIDVSEAPILLSHSNAFSLCDHPRNAPDDVLKRLKANGGAVLATFVPGFVSQALRNWLRGSLDAHGKAPQVADPKARIAALEARQGPAPRATLAEVADHIVYLVETAGIDHVGIGSDFYGGAQPQGLEHVGRFPHLFAELIRRGFSERDLGENRQPQHPARHAQGRAGRRSAAAKCASRRWAGSRTIRGREGASPSSGASSFVKARVKFRQVLSRNVKRRQASGTA